MTRPAIAHTCTKHEPGNVNCYKNHACRCAPCSHAGSADNAYRRQIRAERRAAIAAGATPRPYIRKPTAPAVRPLPHGDWMDEAECAGVRGFTELEASDQQPWCQRCPVRVECLTYGLAQAQYGPEHVVGYGGLGPVELYKLRRTRKATS